MCNSAIYSQATEHCNDDITEDDDACRDVVGSIMTCITLHFCAVEAFVVCLHCISFSSEAGRSLLALGWPLCGFLGTPTPTRPTAHVTHATDSPHRNPGLFYPCAFEVTFLSRSSWQCPLRNAFCSRWFADKCVPLACRHPTFSHAFVSGFGALSGSN